MRSVLLHWHTARPKGERKDWGKQWISKLQEWVTTVQDGNSTPYSFRLYCVVYVLIEVLGESSKEKGRKHIALEKSFNSFV